MRGMAAFAISGCHGSGKTTLCHSVVAKLKRQHVNIGMVSESARSSHYLIGGDKSPEMHLEVMALHVVNEMRAFRMYDVIIADRSIFDFIAYAKVRFPTDFSENLFTGAICKLAESYKDFYSLIFLTSGSYGNPERDLLRAKEITAAQEFDAALRDVLKIYQVECCELEGMDKVDSIATKIIGSL